jgi:hypothetical protein
MAENFVKMLGKELCDFGMLVDGAQSLWQDSTTRSSLSSCASTWSSTRTTRAATSRRTLATLSAGVDDVKDRSMRRYKEGGTWGHARPSAYGLPLLLIERCNRRDSSLPIPVYPHLLLRCRASRDTEGSIARDVERVATA